MIAFSLSGEPQGKGRARSFFRKKAGAAGIKISDFRIGSITPQKTRTYEGMIRTAAMEAMEGREIMQGAIALDLEAVFSVPQSWSKRKREQAIAGHLHHTTRPDGDNVLKAWKDGMRGVVYIDDKQIAQFSGSKRYGVAPSVSVKVIPL